MKKTISDQPDPLQVFQSFLVSNRMIPEGLPVFVASIKVLAETYAMAGNGKKKGLVYLSHFGRYIEDHGHLVFFKSMNGLKKGDRIVCTKPKNGTNKPRFWILLEDANNLVIEKPSKLFVVTEAMVSRLKSVCGWLTKGTLKSVK